MSANDIVEFIKARIDDDERIALSVQDNSAPWTGRWKVDGEHALRTYNDWVLASHHPEPFRPGFLAHVAHNDPARVLRAVEAKRQMMELHASGGDHDCPGTWVGDSDDPAEPCPTHVPDCFRVVRPPRLPGGVDAVMVELEGLPLPRIQYECPLCDYTLDEPPINFAGIEPERPTADIHGLIASVTEQALLRQMREVEAAFREHFAMHTAHVMLEAP